MQFDVKKITLLDKLCEESVKNVGGKKQAISKVIEIACFIVIFSFFLIKTIDVKEV